MGSNAFKYFITLILPGVVSCIFIISRFLVFPYIEVLLGISIMLVFVYGLMSRITGRSSSVDGTMIVYTSNPEKDIYRLILNDDLSELSSKDTIAFEVLHKDIEDDL